MTDESSRGQRGAVPAHLVDVVRAVLRVADSPTRVAAVLREAEGLDWEFLVAWHRDAMEAKRQREAAEIVRCAWCRVTMAAGDSVRRIEAHAGLWIEPPGPTCRACVPAVRRRYERTCDVCLRAYILMVNQDYPFCVEHRVRRYLTEWTRWGSNCVRARLAKVPSTLTLPQWLRALDEFDWSCAYCGRHPFEVMEHFAPIETGGTTAANCVPACNSCNARKHSKTGRDLIAVFGSETVERIMEFLGLDEPP